MLKRLFAGVCIFVAIFFAAACQSSGQGAVSDPSWERVRTQKKLLVGVDESAFPLAYTSVVGAINGFDAELMQEVCRRLDIELEWVPVSAGEGEQRLEAGELDCLWSGIVYNTQRDEEFTLSAPYLKVKQVLAVKKDAAYGNIADLAGAVMGAVEGSSALAAVNKTEEFSASLQSILTFDTVDELIAALDEGSVQVAAIDETVVRYYMLYGKDIRMIESSPDVPEELSQTSMVIAFAWGNDALCAKVQETLSTIMRDQVFQALCEKWFGTALETEIAP